MAVNQSQQKINIAANLIGQASLLVQAYTQYQK